MSIYDKAAPSFISTLEDIKSAVSAPKTEARELMVGFRRASDEGEVPSGAYSVTLRNSGEANVVIGGDALLPGETVTFTAPGDNRLSGISYDATGSDLLITWVREPFS